MCTEEKYRVVLENLIRRQYCATSTKVQRKESQWQTEPMLERFILSHTVKNHVKWCSSTSFFFLTCSIPLSVCPPSPAPPPPSPSSPSSSSSEVKTISSGSSPLSMASCRRRARSTSLAARSSSSISASCWRSTSIWPNLVFFQQS